MQLSFILAGANFRPKEAKDYIKEEMGPGSPIRLEREATNAYDSNAIKILSDDIFIGYVPKSDNSVLAQYLDADVEYSIECVGFVGTLQPMFECNFQHEEAAA